LLPNLVGGTPDAFMKTQQVYSLPATLFLVIWRITTASVQGIDEMFPLG